MSDGDDSSRPSLVDSVADQFNKLPASQDASAPRHRLFGRERSVRQILGDSELSDIILWRKRHLSVGILVAATAIWIIFEWLDYHVLSLGIWGLLIMFGLFFVWSHAASFLNRPPPPVKNLYLSEETAIRSAQTIRRAVNQFVIMLHDIALGKDIKLFLMIESSLWLLSIVGGWCDFLTLIYAGVVLVLTVPVLYEQYEDKIDSSVERGLQESQRLYEKTYGIVANKVNQTRGKDKKTQ